MDATEICGMLDYDLVKFIHNVVVLLKILVPVILIVLGMLDFAKGVLASKEDEIKKGQQVFIKRLIAGACVFLVVTVVQLVMGIISKDDGSFIDCANKILNGTTGEKYKPTGVTGNENNNNNNENNNNHNENNGEKEELPIIQQQVGEGYEGEGLINNSNVPNGGYSTTTTTTTTNPDYKPTEENNNGYQGQGLERNNSGSSTSSTTTTTTTTTN